jgi:hypothetical protein
MKKTFITFGQCHTHRINGKTLDKDCVAAIKSDSEEEGRKIAFELFKGAFHNSYFSEELDKNVLKYFPRGIIDVN